MYLPVLGPIMEPMKIPINSIPIRGQWTITPFKIIKLKMAKIMPINTERAEVPATTNIGRPTTLVRNGTYKNPPPIPRKEAMAEMKKPPTNAQIGLKLNV